MAYLVLLCLTSLYFADAVVFYKLKACGNPTSGKSVGAIPSTAFSHFVSLGHHFGNSHNISSFFIIIIFLMAICHQRSLMLLL